MPPGDRKHFQSSGPFNMAPADTQEIVIAIIVSQGSDNLNSVTSLKRDASAIQLFYDDSFQKPMFQRTKTIPDNYFITQNYPNPFNPFTSFKYGIPYSQNVRIVLYNALGQAVKTLVNEQKEAGEYEQRINGEELSSGVYFLFIEASEFAGVKKILLLK